MSVLVIYLYLKQQLYVNAIQTLNCQTKKFHIIITKHFIMILKMTFLKSIFF